MMTPEESTQSAYLQTARVRPDSEILESPEVAYIRTPSSQERWMNAIVRMTYSPKDFGKVERVVELFDKSQINFNWHCWPTSHPELLPFLTKKIKMQSLGTLDFVCKPLIASRQALEDQTGFEELSPNTLEAYVTAKMSGWNNAPQWRPEMEEATRVACKDPRQKTIVLTVDSRIVGAVSYYTASDTAYLRGDFVIPDFRGRGLFRKLITYREQVLSRKGVKLVTALADPNTSSRIYQKLGYAKRAEVALLSRRKSPWVSL